MPAENTVFNKSIKFYGRTDKRAEYAYAMLACLLACLLAMILPAVSIFVNTPLKICYEISMLKSTAIDVGADTIRPPYSIELLREADSFPYTLGEISC